MRAKLKDKWKTDRIEAMVDEGKGADSGRLQMGDKKKKT